MGDMQQMNKHMEQLSARIAKMKMVELFNLTKDVKGVNVVATMLDDTDTDALRVMGDEVKARAPKMVAVLAAVNNGKINFLCVCGGGGGGRPDSATAGGKDPSKLEMALESVNDIVAAQLG